MHSEQVTIGFDWRSLVLLALCLKLIGGAHPGGKST